MKAGFLLDHRGFIKSLLLTLLLVLVCIGLSNSVVVPARIFRSTYSYEGGIAALLAEGKSVVGVERYDDRILQRYRAQVEKGRQVDYLVIGSSRSNQLSRRTTKSALLNLSVAGASLEDYIALIELGSAYSVKGTVLGVDPWIFNRNSGQNRWGSIEEEYGRGVNEIAGSFKGRYEGSISKSERHGGEEPKFLQLINFEYTKPAISRIASYILGGRDRG